MKYNDNLRYAHLLYAQNELKEKINEQEIHWELDKKYFQEKIKHTRGVKREAWKEILIENAIRQTSKIENMKKDLIKMQDEALDIKIKLMKKEKEEDEIYPFNSKEELKNA